MLLDVKSVDKKFNGVYALKGLDFSLSEGEVHGLVGENGAGKSTFIKILGGVYKRDGGSILWNGKDLPKTIRPEESRNLGINIIFQDNVLIPAFTGMENICLGRPYPVKGGIIQWKEMERETEAKAAELGIHLDLKTPVSMMTPAQKKCVEIVRAMMSDCKLLILDEPTASLSDKETNLLFSIVRNLKAKGTSVLYVTHRLEEIMELIQQKQYVDVQHLAAQHPAAVWSTARWIRSRSPAPSISVSSPTRTRSATWMRTASIRAMMSTLPAVWARIWA